MAWLTDVVNPFYKVAPTIFQDIEARQDFGIPFSHSIYQSIDDIDLIIDYFDGVARKAKFRDVQLNAVSIGVKFGYDETAMGPIFPPIIGNLIVLIL